MVYLVTALLEFVPIRVWYNVISCISGSCYSEVIFCIVQTLHDEIDSHREPVRHLDLTGTYLKYLGSRADICELGQRLMTVRLHWKRLVQRAAEVKQQLRQAFQETKRVNMHTYSETQVYAYTKVTGVDYNN